MTWTLENIVAMVKEERDELLTVIFRWIREVNGGRLPFGAYKERVRTWHTPFVDVAVILNNSFVLLERRRRGSHLYPGMLDIPGGNFAGRETVREAAWRIAEKLGFSEPLEFAGVASYVKTEAEVGISFLFVVRINEEPAQLPEGCCFYRFQFLPSDVVPWQGAAYPVMLAKFLSSGVPPFMEYKGV